MEPPVLFMYFLNYFESPKVVPADNFKKHTIHKRKNGSNLLQFDVLYDIIIYNRIAVRNDPDHRMPITLLAGIPYP